MYRKKNEQSIFSQAMKKSHSQSFESYQEELNTIKSKEALASYKKDFPIFDNSDLVYLDSAASAQKPRIVLKAMNDFYETSYSNIHRGTCSLAIHATEIYENARKTVADFIHTDVQNIIFTKGATDAINMVASGIGQSLKPGDEILVSIAEHHANFVPWQQICFKTGATFKVFNVLSDGRIDIEDFKSKLSSKTKMVAITHLSNVLGVVNPVKEMTQLAHNVGSLILVDGAQSIAHMPINVAELEADYFVFSSHKLYGPTGIGVLYGKREALENLPPYQFGGDMVQEVSVQKTTFADLPARLEAGTTPFVEAAGMGVAIEYIRQIGMEKIAAYEQMLTDLLMDGLKEIPSIELLGTTRKSGLVSFNIESIHPNDLAFVLAKQNICVRVGHHCAMPIHECFGKSASVRVSFGIYNTQDDVKLFLSALKKALTFF